METPEGDILQDSSDIIEYVKLRYPRTNMIPETRLLRTVSVIIDAFGTQGLLPIAMHYCWSFRDQQENFLRNEFSRIQVNSPEREFRQNAGAQIMDYFNGFLPSLGLRPDNIDRLVPPYLNLLDALDIHLATPT